MKIKSIKRTVLQEEKQFYDVIEAQPHNNFLIKTNSDRYIVSHNCSFEDEINFASMTTDVEKIKAKQKHLISQVDARMQSRFMKGTKLPTLNIIASSKTSDQSFLDGYINTKKKNESKTTLIIDEPQWVVRNDKDSPIKFYVAVGNKFLASEVLPRDASDLLIESYRAKGYKMMQVPIGYWEAFNDNVELALTDIAGISTTSALKYISGVRLNEIKIDTYKNPFQKDVIEVGTGDDLQYSQFFDLNSVPNTLKSKPLYIHLDMSKSGDKTGIAGVWIMGKRFGSSNDSSSKETYYRAAFSVSVKAPKGREISFEKNRTFVRWLKSQGFNIKGVSFDTYQSAQLSQQLEADGFNVKVISVDRLDNIPGTNTKVCLPYAYFKSTIYEGRLELYRKCDLLTDEIVGLEKEPDGHINHPEGGTQGSKDAADALCIDGNTKIFLTSGNHKTIKELYEDGYDNEYILAYDVDSQSVVVEPIKNIVYNGKKDTIKLTFDNGEELVCTPDHKLLTRDGSYVEASDSLNVSLMPFNYDKKIMYKNREYVYLYIPKNNYTNDGIYLHKLVAEQYHKDEYIEKTSNLQENEWIVIHHKDVDRFNNNPDNLIYVTNIEHSKIHTELNSTPLKRKQLSDFNKKLVASGEHPFCKLTPEQRRLTGTNSLTKWNKSDAHRKKTSEKNMELLSKGIHNFQLYKGSAFTKEANAKREKTCNERYGGIGFCSDLIQKKCRESCLKNNGYDNPWHSKEKQHESQITKLKNAFNMICNKYNIDGEYMSYIDFKIYCYIEHLAVSSKEDDIKEASLPIISDDFKKDNKYFNNNIRIVGTFINRFIKDTGKNQFTLLDLIKYRDENIATDDKFKNQFNKPSIRNLDVNLILKMGFNLYNHRVVSIEYVGERDVYDLQLCGIHNFALTCGIFVHNCGSLYFASQNVEQYAYDYGEDLDTVLNYNQITTNQHTIRRQVNIEFEKELQNMLVPKSIQNAINEDNKNNNNSTSSRPIVSGGMLIW